MELTEAQRNDPRWILYVKKCEVEAAYIEFRRRLHPNYTPKNPERWQTCWEKTAKLLIEQGWGAEEYIRAQFLNITGHRVPQPTMLYGGDAREKMHQYLNTGSHWPQKVQNEISFFKSRLRLFGDPRVVLELPQAPFSLAFKWLTATRYGFDARPYIAGRKLLEDTHVREVYAQIDAFKTVIKTVTAIMTDRG